MSKSEKLAAAFITFEPDGRRVKGEVSSNIFKLIYRSGIGIRFDCGGNGLCGKCKIIVKEQSKLSLLTDIERKHLTPYEIRNEYRLACQSRLMGNLTIMIPEESKIRFMKFQVKGIERTVRFNPNIIKVYLCLSEPTISDSKPDSERLLDALKECLGPRKLEINYNILRVLPKILRQVSWEVTVTLRKNEVIFIEPGNMMGPYYGVAIDIGTSKIVAYIIDLSDGRLVSTSAIVNPQVVHGEDVISRIFYASASDELLDELKSFAIEGVNNVIFQACIKAGINPLNVYEATIVGNTAMLHLFLGVQPKFLAVAPYIPAVRRSLDIRAEDIGIKINQNGNIHTLPIIAGFVGSDNVSCILSTGIHESDEMCLLIDIGTNTEIDVGNRDEILCCSCASGPAFEGYHITHGMKAVNGAIERVMIDSHTYEVDYKTIGELKPLGICGSAMIDILAEMLKCHVIDCTGRLNTDISTSRLKRFKKNLGFVIVFGKKTGTKEDIIITQNDIRELQLAKAAIHAGCSILMGRKGVKPRDIKKVYIAGAFGNNINPENAKTIGLIPDIPVERIKFVGNAAISGAKMVLTSKEAREEAIWISRRVKYIELGAEPNFNDEFTSSLSFPKGV